MDQTRNDNHEARNETEELRDAAQHLIAAKRNAFLEAVRRLVDCWKKTNAPAERLADGVAFSILVLIDGASAMNNFSEIALYEDGIEINRGVALHEFYYREEDTGIKEEPA